MPNAKRFLGKQKLFLKGFARLAFELVLCVMPRSPGEEQDGANQEGDRANEEHLSVHAENFGKGAAD